MFTDRTNAGKQLGAILARFRESRPLILGIPRGGVIIAYEVARALAAPFEILVVRKLPFPDNPESGFGAIDEDGGVYLTPAAGATLDPAVVDLIIREQRAEAARRVRALRRGRPLPDLRDRLAIVVDDGIAMGSTMQAAVRCCRNRGAQRVIAAAPVASRNAVAALKQAADEVVVLLAPPLFRAVADYYQQWYDVPDREVVELMQQAASEGLLAAPGREPAASGKAARVSQPAAPAPFS